MSIIYGSPSDPSVPSSLFLVAADAFCQSFSTFFGAINVNIFSSVNRNDANVTG